MKTKVVFRKFKGNKFEDDGEIIALFPEEPADRTGMSCVSYMHNGQHGAADTPPDNTVLATPEEYADLKAELENFFGYELEIVKRITNAMTTKRFKAACPEVRI